MREVRGIRSIGYIRIVNVLTLALLWWLVATGAAWAQPQLEASFPVAGTTVTEAPGEVTLVFDEPIQQDEGTRYVLIQETGDEHTIHTRVLTDEAAREINVPLPDLEPGHYEFRWHIVTAKGDELHGALEFSFR